MSKRICNQSYTCSHRKREKACGFECGGAQLHSESECEPCPVYKDAVCVPIYAHYHHMCIMYLEEEKKADASGDSTAYDRLGDYLDWVGSQMDEEETEAANKLCATIEILDDADPDDRIGGLK